MAAAPESPLNHGGLYLAGILTGSIFAAWVLKQIAKSAAPAVKKGWATAGPAVKKGWANLMLRCSAAPAAAPAPAPTVAAPAPTNDAPTDDYVV